MMYECGYTGLFFDFESINMPSVNGVQYIKSIYAIFRMGSLKR